MQVHTGATAQKKSIAWELVMIIQMVKQWHVSMSIRIWAERWHNDVNSKFFKNAFAVFFVQHISRCCRTTSSKFKMDDKAQHNHKFNISSKKKMSQIWKTQMTRICFTGFTVKTSLKKGRWQAGHDSTCLNQLEQRGQRRQRRWMLEAQLAFHKEQVCTCGQLEVQLSQQHGRLQKIPQPQLAALQQCLQFRLPRRWLTKECEMDSKWMPGALLCNF